jgi:dTMP kinase
MATFLAEFSADDIAMFISFEGGEGAGKSTQLRRLGAAFERAGLPVITTREPGGCDSAEQIRALLVSGDPDRWRPQTEALLMMAARSEHLERTIKHALDAQKWVLCDRFFDSTLVYQGHAKGLGEDWLWQLYRLLFGQMLPALTIYLDIDPALGLARTHSRDGCEARFEGLPLAFHQQVRAGFVSLAERSNGRIITVDAAANADAVHHHITRILNDRFSLNLEPTA